MTDCVWLHGTAMAGLRWHDSLPGDWLELPGHGQAPRVEPNVEAYASALESRLPERFVIGGHSLGGMVALTLASRHLDRCRGLVLVDTPLRMPRWIRRRAKVAPLIAWPSVVGFLIQYRTSNRAMRPTLRRTSAAPPRKGLIDAMRATLRFDGRVLARGLTLPILSLLGRHSLLTGPSDAVGTSRVFDAGHILPVDRPDDVAREIHGFLERFA